MFGCEAESFLSVAISTSCAAGGRREGASSGSGGAARAEGGGARERNFARGHRFRTTALPRSARSRHRNADEVAPSPIFSTNKKRPSAVDGAIGEDEVGASSEE